MLHEIIKDDSDDRTYGRLVDVLQRIEDLEEKIRSGDQYQFRSLGTMKEECLECMDKLEHNNARPIAELLQKIAQFAVEEANPSSPCSSPMRPSAARKYGQMLAKGEWTKSGLELLEEADVEGIEKATQMKTPHVKMLRTYARTDIKTRRMRVAGFAVLAFASPLTRSSKKRLDGSCGPVPATPVETNSPSTGLLSPGHERLRSALPSINGINEKVKRMLSVPSRITEADAQTTKQQARGLVPAGHNFTEFYPEVILSYASGRRTDMDCEGAGPGLYYAFGFLKLLSQVDIPAFSGLTVPAGSDWKAFMLRLEGRKANAKVLVVLLTAAFFQSKACLDEVSTAIENKIPLLPVSLEEPLPKRNEQWSRLDSEEDELKITNVQRTLGKVNAIPHPGTLLTIPETLEEIFKSIGKHIDIPEHEIRQRLVRACRHGSSRRWNLDEIMST